MSSDGLASLAMVRAFLSDEILPVVPDSLSGELRAALKILDTVALELDGLFPRLQPECAQLLHACGDTLAAVSDEPAYQSLALRHGSLAKEYVQAFATTTELLRFSDTVRDLMGDLIVLLLAHGGDGEQRRLLECLYSLLSEHAAARLRWQSVFLLNDCPNKIGPTKNK